ncbi:MAG: helix-turn-helix domain-containing protein [Patescibacteria group bacterium]
MEKQLISTTELSKILGISRVAVFKKIKSGKIKAQKVGRNFVINRRDLAEILGDVLSEEKKREIEKAVKKTVKEYGETLKLLGKE